MLTDAPLSFRGLTIRLFIFVGTKHSADNLAKEVRIISQSALNSLGLATIMMIQNGKVRPLNLEKRVLIGVRVFLKPLNDFRYGVVIKRAGRLFARQGI